MANINLSEYLLSTDDQDYITTFVNNATNNLKNDKMIILLGSGKNGKTSLLNEITRHLHLCASSMRMEPLLFADENAPELAFSKRKGVNGGAFYCVRLNFGDFLNKPLRKMVLLDDGWLFERKYVTLLKYLLTNKTENIIAVANTLTGIDDGLLEQSRIIRMKHVF